MSFKVKQFEEHVYVFTLQRVLCSQIRTEQSTDDDKT